MGENSKSWTFEIQNLKQAVWLQNNNNFKLNGQLSYGILKVVQRIYYNLLNSAFWGWISVESQPQNPENFHPWQSMDVDEDLHQN